MTCVVVIHRRPAISLLVTHLLGCLCAPIATAGQSLGRCGQTAPPIVEASPSSDVIVVTARRHSERFIDAPATMTVITEEAIRNAPAQNITDLMRMVPGVNIVQTSARDINITLRTATGTLADSTLVLLDGRSMYQDFFGFVMWDFIPVDSAQIKQIEIIRGPASAVWGANAMTGVVNVITKTPRELASEGCTSVSFQFGHFDRTQDGHDYDGGGLFSVSATHAQAPTDQFAFKISGGFLGQEALLRPVGNVPSTRTPYPPFTNRGTAQPKLDGRADYTFADRRQTLILAGGIAGTEGIIHTGLGPLDIHGGSTFKYGKVVYERERLKLQMFVNAADAEATFLLLQATNGQTINPFFESQVYDVEFSNLNVLGTRHLLSYGGNFRHNRFDSSLTPEGAPRNEGGAYVQDEIFLSDRIRWTVGARADRFGSTHRTAVSPRTALVLKPRPNHAVRLSYNRAFRAPSLFNNFADLTFLTQINLPSAGEFHFPSVFTGNRALSEEALTAYEASYTGTWGPATVGAAMYFNKTRNDIMFTPVSTYTSTAPPPDWPLPVGILDTANLPSEYSYRNFDEVTDRGIELSVDTRFGRSITAFANYTWEDVPEPGNFSPSELNVPPQHQFNAGVSLTRTRYFGSLSASFRDKAFWQDVDPRYSAWSTPFTVLNAGVGVRSTDGTMTVAVRITNVVNRTIHEHTFGDIIKRAAMGEARLIF